MSANRPLLQPNIRIIVTTPTSLEELSPSEIDSLQADINRHVRQNQTKVGHVHVDEDNRGTGDLIFDLDISTTEFEDIDEIQRTISKSIKSILGVSAREEHFTLDANIKRVFP